MNIAIDVSPLQSGHKIRGTGFYLTHLKEALLEYYPRNIYHFFTNKNQLPKNIDGIHYPYFDPFFVTLPFFKRYKTVVTVHDLTPLVFPKDFPSGKKGMLKWHMQKRNLRQVDAIITDSYSSKKDIEKICGYSSENIHVVYLAAAEHFKKLPNDVIEHTRKKYNLPKEFILYVGDATANKNLPRLLKAIEILKKPFIIVGKTLSEESIDSSNAWNKSLVKTKELIQQNPLVRALGFVSDDELVALYNAATVFVMPSLYEGFGLPILEAMSCGCPVVTTKEGSLGEVAGDAALYVDAFSSEDIANGIQQVIGDTSLQKNLSEKGLTHAKHFSWGRTAKETMQVYEKVFQSK